MKLYPVTIGIPSYNEQRNIINLLESIFSSDTDEIYIEEVIISDDSTDCTPQLIQDYIDRNPLKNILLCHHSLRRGTAAAWNEIFDKAKGRTLILFDADVIVDRNCIAELVGTLRREEKVGLCATNQIPVDATGISGKACLFIMEWLRTLRKTGLSKYTVMGRALCIHSDVTKNLHIPEEVIAVDLYLQCLTMKKYFNITYNDNAIVYFKPPTNLSEFSSQVIRAQNGHKQVTNLPIYPHLEPSLRSLLASVLSSIRSKPVEAVAATISLASVLYFSRRLAGTNNAKWNTLESTKSIDYDKFISRHTMENST